MTTTKHEIRITTKIVHELAQYFLVHGHKRVTIETVLEDEVTYFHITLPRRLKDEVLETMQKKLSREREVEVETYGFELVGDIDSKSELEIVGVLVDDMAFKRTDDTTVITLSRTSKYRKQ